MNANLNPGIMSEKETRRCDLCGSSEAAVCCLNCNNQVFCPSCDDMYHRHPKRQTHTRTSISHVGQENIRPPLPPKGLTSPVSPPIAPPRRNKGRSRNESFGGNLFKNLVNPNVNDRASTLQRMSTRPLPNVPATQNNCISATNRHDFISNKSMTLSRDPVSSSTLQQRYQRHQEMMRGTAPDLSRDFSNMDIRNDQLSHKNMIINENMWNNDRRVSMPERNVAGSFRDRNVMNDNSINHSDMMPDDFEGCVPSPPSSHKSLKRETSASVFNLNTSHTKAQRHIMEQQRFNNMMQAQSMAQLGCMNCQHQHHMGNMQPDQWMPWATRYGSNMSLNMPAESYPRPPMWMNMAPWCGPMPMYPTPLLPPHHTGTNRISASRSQSRVHSRAASPTASIRSRRSRVSRKTNMEREDLSDEEELRRPTQRREESILSNRRKLSQSSTDPPRSFTPIQDTRVSTMKENKSNKIKPPLSPRSKSRSSITYEMNSSRTSSDIETDCRSIPKEELQEVINELPDGDKLNVPPPPTPQHPWICEHCTFVNEPGVKVCDVCCKTPTAPPQVSTTNQSDSKVLISKKLPQSDIPDELEYNDKKKSSQVAPKASPETDSNDEKSSRVIKGDSVDAKTSLSTKNINTRSPTPDTMRHTSENTRSPSQISERNVIIRARDTKPKAEKVSTGCGPSPPKEILSDKDAQTRGVECETDKKTSDEIKSVVANLTPAKKETMSTGTSPLPQSISTQTYDVVLKKIESPHRQDTDDSKSTQGTGKLRRFNRPMKRSNSLHNSKTPNDEEMRSNSRKSNRSTSRLSYSSDAHSAPTTPSRDGSPTPSPYSMGYEDFPQRDVKQLGHMGPMRSRSNSLLAYGLGMGMGPPTSYRSTTDLRKPDLYRDDWRNPYLDPYMYHNQRNDYISYRGESQPRDMGSGPYMMDQMMQRRPSDVIKSQGMELVKLLREAELNNFSAEELQIAIANGGTQNPINWLKENWPQMIETVLTVATNYGRESKENNVGTISQIEARDALKKHKGSVWQAVTECVEQRQKKFSEIQSKGKFTRQDILTCLTAHQGDLDAALLELSKTQLKPFLMRIWGPPSGRENESGNMIATGQVPNKDIPQVNSSLGEDGEKTGTQSLLEYINAHAEQVTLPNEASLHDNRLVSVNNNESLSNKQIVTSPSSGNQDNIPNYENNAPTSPSLQLLESFRDLLLDVDIQNRQSVLKDIENIVTKFDKNGNRLETNNNMENIINQSQINNQSQLSSVHNKNNNNESNQIIKSNTESSKDNMSKVCGTKKKNKPNKSEPNYSNSASIEHSTKDSDHNKKTIVNHQNNNTDIQVRNTIALNLDNVNVLHKLNENQNIQLVIADNIKNTTLTTEVIPQNTTLSNETHIHSATVSQQTLENEQNKPPQDSNKELKPQDSTNYTENNDQDFLVTDSEDEDSESEYEEEESNEKHLSKSSLSEDPQLNRHELQETDNNKVQTSEVQSTVSDTINASQSIDSKTTISENNINETDTSQLNVSERSQHEQEAQLDFNVTGTSLSSTIASQQVIFKRNHLEQESQLNFDILVRQNIIPVTTTFQQDTSEKSQLQQEPQMGDKQAADLQQNQMSKPKTDLNNESNVQENISENSDSSKTSQPLYNIMEDTQQLIRQMRDELKSDIETYKSSETSDTESDYEDDRTSLSSPMPQSTENDSQSEEEEEDSFSQVHSNNSEESDDVNPMKITHVEIVNDSKISDYTSDENEKYEEAIEKSDTESNSNSDNDSSSSGKIYRHDKKVYKQSQENLQIFDDLAKGLQQQSESLNEFHMGKEIMDKNNQITITRESPLSGNRIDSEDMFESFDKNIEESIVPETQDNLPITEYAIKLNENESNLTTPEKNGTKDNFEIENNSESYVNQSQNLLNIPYADDSSISEQESTSVSEVIHNNSIITRLNILPDNEKNVDENYIDVTIAIPKKEVVTNTDQVISSEFEHNQQSTQDESFNNSEKMYLNNSGEQNINNQNDQSREQITYAIQNAEQNNDHRDLKTQNIILDPSHNYRKNTQANVTDLNYDANQRSKDLTAQNSNDYIPEQGAENITSVTNIHTSKPIINDTNETSNTKKPKTFTSQIPKLDKNLTKIPTKIPLKNNQDKKVLPLQTDKISPFCNFQSGHVRKLQQGLFNKVDSSPLKTTNKITPKIPVPINTKTNAEIKTLSVKKVSTFKTSNDPVQPTSSNKVEKNLNEKKSKQFFVETCLSDEYFTDEDVKLPLKPVEKRQNTPGVREEAETSTKEVEEVLPDNILIINKRRVDLSAIHLKEDSPERQIRMLMAEGIVPSWEQAEVALELVSRKFDKATALATANECTTLEAALAYLQQECELCTGKYPMKEMVSMLKCIHRCCKECAKNYFSIQITDRSILECTCPYCKLPELHEHNEDEILEYFSNLDILLKSILEENVHELFQRKLRDRTLMQDPNFRWCIGCSSGFIVNPRQKRHICPDCRTITCAQCRKPWESQHEGISCEKFAEWKELNDPNVQTAGINKHLDDHGIDCPKCKFRFALSRGGCMHFTCSQCKYEFCCGCDKAFKMGAKCGLSPYCAKLGLHAHHPRNCLFYLRDKEPRELQTLLQLNNIEFKTDPPESSIDEKPKTRCPIQLQRETPGGLVDGLCNSDIEPKSAGLCKVHYVEYLVGLMKSVDPLPIMDLSEMVAELRRMAIALPERGPWDTDPIYAEMCSKIIKEQIPLD